MSLKSNSKVAIIFSGYFPEGNTKNARLKMIATELQKYNWETSFYIAMPYRFSKNIKFKQPKHWKGC